MFDIQISLLVISHAIAYLLCGIFISAGMSKLKSVNHSFYVRAIKGYNLTPVSWADFLPRVIGVSEVLIGAFLIVPTTQTFALLAAVVMLSIYLLAFIKQLQQGKADMDCGCAGPGAEVKISPMLLLRNTALVVLSIFAVWVLQEPVVDISIILFSVVLPVVMVMGLVYISTEQLIVNGQKIQKLRQSIQ